MRYRRFEMVVIVLGSIVVLATVAASALGGNAEWPTLVGELLVIPVLAAAAHWGRKGGFFSAAFAIVFYVVLMVAVAARASGVTPPLVELVILLMVAYGAVGVVGGEACSRIKYYLTRIDGGGGLDSDTRLYSETVSRNLIESGLARFRRYSTPLSIIILTIPAGPFSGMKPMQRRLLLQRSIDRVRRDLRLVDDAGRLKDGRLVVILPSTESKGAEVVARRLSGVMADALEAPASDIGVQVMGCDSDHEALEQFARTLDDGSAEESSAPEGVPA